MHSCLYVLLLFVVLGSAAEELTNPYQFARSKATDVHSASWDLVVIDEAHRGTILAILQSETSETCPLHHTFLVQIPAESCQRSSVIHLPCWLSMGVVAKPKAPSGKSLLL